MRLGSSSNPFEKSSIEIDARFSISPFRDSDFQSFLFFDEYFDIWNNPARWKQGEVPDILEKPRACQGLLRGPLANTPDDRRTRGDDLSKGEKCAT
jgi:hypothetical protein